MAGRPFSAPTGSATHDALERGNATGRATREVLMMAAERLFAEKGLHGVSMREIGLLAGQRNNNVVPYHFGDRAGLVRSIYAFRSEALDRRRFELLAEAETAGQADDVKVLLRALLQPHAESIVDDRNYFLGFLARLILDEGSMAGEGSPGAEPHMGAHWQIRDRIRGAVGGTSGQQFYRRFELLLNFAIVAFAVEKRRLHQDRVPVAVQDSLEEVVGVMAAGLLAQTAGVR